MQLKRLWDITNKKMVFVKWPTGHESQLWVDEATGKMYYYDMAQWLEYEQSAANDGKTYWPTWKVVDWDDNMWVYDTDKPTDLFVWEDGDEVSYVFKDWDNTVLKEGKVKEWTEPTPPADPTREATAQYTYTFTGWNPAVAPITRKTTYTAQYSSTVNSYTVTFVDDDGTTVLDEQTLDYWATPVYAWETPTKEPTAQYTYTFSGWNPEIATVTGNATYTAVYEATVNQYTVTISADPTEWSVDVNSLTVDYGTAFSSNSNVLTVGETEVTATAESWYEFDAWSPASGTVTWNVTISATFTSGGWTVTYQYSAWQNSVDLQTRLTNDGTWVTLESSWWNVSWVECQKFIDWVYDSSTYMVYSNATWDWEVSIDTPWFVVAKCGSDSSIISYQYIGGELLWYDLNNPWTYLYYNYVEYFENPSLMTDTAWNNAMSWAENPFTITTTISWDIATIYSSLWAGTDTYSASALKYNTNTDEFTLFWNNETYNWASDVAITQTLSNSWFLTAWTISSPTMTDQLNLGGLLEQAYNVLAMESCTVTIVANPVEWWTVDINQVTTSFGDQPYEDGNTLEFFNDTVTATANAGYEFVSWDCPAVIAKDTTVYANFQEEQPL